MLPIFAPFIKELTIPLQDYINKNNDLEKRSYFTNKDLKKAKLNVAINTINSINSYLSNTPSQALTNINILLVSQISSVTSLNKAYYSGTGDLLPILEGIHSKLLVLNDRFITLLSWYENQQQIVAQQQLHNYKIYSLDHTLDTPLSEAQPPKSIILTPNQKIIVTLPEKKPITLDMPQNLIPSKISTQPSLKETTDKINQLAQYAIEQAFSDNYIATPGYITAMNCCEDLLNYLLNLYKQEAQQSNNTKPGSFATHPLNNPIINCLTAIKDLLKKKNDYICILEATKERLTKLKELEKWKFDLIIDPTVKDFVTNHVDQLIADLKTAQDSAKQQNSSTFKPGV